MAEQGAVTGYFSTPSAGNSPLIVKACFCDPSHFSATTLSRISQLLPQFTARHHSVQPLLLSTRWPRLGHGLKLACPLEQNVPRIAPHTRDDLGGRTDVVNQAHSRSCPRYRYYRRSTNRAMGGLRADLCLLSVTDHSHTRTARTTHAKAVSRE